MNRRKFFGLLAGLPLVGKMLPEMEPLPPENIWSDFTHIWYGEANQLVIEYGGDICHWYKDGKHVKTTKIDGTLIYESN